MLNELLDGIMERDMHCRASFLVGRVFYGPVTDERVTALQMDHTPIIRLLKEQM